VERHDLKPKDWASRLERVVVDQDGVPLIPPAQAQISQAIHRRVQAITTRILNNYIGPVTGDTMLMLLHEIGRTLATGGAADVERVWSRDEEEATEIPEPVRDGLGPLLTAAGVVEARLDQNLNESRTMTLTFVPQLGDIRVDSRTDVTGHPIISMAFDLGGMRSM